MLAILFNVRMIRESHLLVFGDNMGVLSAVVKGRSAVLDMNALLGGLHLLLLHTNCTPWWEYVDSRANPADGGTRIGLTCPIAAALGFQLQERCFPTWPESAERMMPSQWLDVFQSCNADIVVTRP